MSRRKKLRTKPQRLLKYHEKIVARGARPGILCGYRHLTAAIASYDDIDDRDIRSRSSDGGCAFREAEAPRRCCYGAHDVVAECPHFPKACRRLRRADRDLRRCRHDRVHEL